MNVITSNPILQMSSFEGNKNDVARVKAFQYFVILNEKPTQVIVNGIWDKETEEASKIWGKQFDKLTYKDQNFVSKINEMINAPKSKSGTNTEAEAAAAALLAGLKSTETTLTDDEKKAKRMKTALVVAGVIVVAFLGYKMMKKK